MSAWWNSARGWGAAVRAAAFLWGARWWPIIMGVQFAVLLAQADRPPAGAAAVYLLGIAMALMLPLHWRRAGLRQLAQVIFGTGLLVRTARLVVLYLEAAQTGAPGPNLAAISGNLAIVVLMLRVFASDDRLLGEGDLLIESTPQRRPTA